MNTHRIAVIILMGAALPLLSTGCHKKSLFTGNPAEEWAHCQGLSVDKHYQEAVECFEVFKSRYPMSQEGIEADLWIGDNYFRKKDFLLAAEAYKNFLKLHPNHPRLDYATYRTGLSYLRESPKAIDRDQEHLDDAIQYLREAAFLFPDSEFKSVSEEKLLEARNRLAARSLYVGRFYYRTGEYLAAIPRFVSVVDAFPESPVAPKAYFLLIKSQLKLGRPDEARTALERFRTVFPNHPLAKQAGKKLKGDHV